MSYFEVREFDKLILMSLRIGSTGSVSGTSFRMGGRAFRNKALVYSLDKDYTLRSILHRQCFYYLNAGSKLFIAQKVRTPRDLFRNSGYKLVRDPESADMTVLPSYLNEVSSPYVGDLILFNPPEKELCIITVNRDFSPRTKEQDDLAIRSYLQTDRPDGTITMEGKGIRAFVIPRVKEYYDIINESYPGRKYIAEVSVPLTYPVQISTETLTIWKHQTSDADLLAKAIVASNWKEYPFTLLAFLSAECQYLYYRGGDGFKLVCDAIGFRPRVRFEELAKDKVISAKDWNLLQQFACEQLGVSENGGFTKPQEDNFYSRFLYTRCAYKPLMTPADCSYANLMATLKNG